MEYRLQQVGCNRDAVSWQAGGQAATVIGRITYPYPQVSGAFEPENGKNVPPPPNLINWLSSNENILLIPFLHELGQTEGTSRDKERFGTMAARQTEFRTSFPSFHVMHPSLFLRLGSRSQGGGRGTLQPTMTVGDPCVRHGGGTRPPSTGFTLRASKYPTSSYSSSMSLGNGSCQPSWQSCASLREKLNVKP
jgi:hypothetical protein